tara:strand:- start:27321 stop:27737 length:417 start_codon:yes stop_codon:yes gene_type:complete
MRKTEDKAKCTECGGENQLTDKAYDGGHVSECKTICTNCGHPSYWAFGYFQNEGLNPQAQALWDLMADRNRAAQESLDNMIAKGDAQTDLNLFVAKLAGKENTRRNKPGDTKIEHGEKLLLGGLLVVMFILAIIIVIN